MSSWTHASFVPLMILYALKPRWQLSRPIRLDELFCHSPYGGPPYSWDRRTLARRRPAALADRALKLYEKFPWKPWRCTALHRAERWILERLERNDGLGAIYPAMMNSIFALRALGYPADDPLILREMEHLAGLEIEAGDMIRLQPCLSPACYEDPALKGQETSTPFANRLGLAGLARGR